MADKFTKRRKGIRSSVTADCNKAAALMKEASLSTENTSQLRVYYKRVEHNLQRLYELDAEVVEALDEESLDTEIAATVNYNERVQGVLFEMEERLTQKQSPTAAVQSTATVDSAPTATAPSPERQIKLPTFEMPKYKGDPMAWQAFWDIYKATIHDNESLSTVVKFSYLLEYLEDDAYALASGYSLTAANYDHVIAALQERFGDKERAQFAHFMALAEIDRAKNNSLTELRRVSDQCELHIRSLVALELPEDTFAIVFIPLILSKLPKYLTTKICEKNGKNKWSLSEVRDWIKADMRAREMGESSFTGSTNLKDKQDKSNIQRTSGVSQPGRMPTSASSLTAPGYGGNGQRGPAASQRYGGNNSWSRFATPGSNWIRPPQSPSLPCIYCNVIGHYHQDCQAYPSREARLTVLKSFRPSPCFKCLRDGHVTTQCYFRQRPCMHCQQPGHHASLCPLKYGQASGQRYLQQGQKNQGKLEKFQQKDAKGNKPPLDQSGHDGRTPSKTSANVAVAQENTYNTDVAFLQTAIVSARNASGNKTISGRALMDSASSRTYVTENFCRQLELQNIGSTYLSIGRFGTTRRSTQQMKRVRFDIVCKDGSIQPVLAHVQSIISCPVARHPIDPVVYPITNEIDLAEPLNKVPDSLEIDILIGNDQYYNFVSTTGAITAGEGLVFVPSRLGYLTAGTMAIHKGDDGAPESTLCMLRPEAYPESQSECTLERFWQIEDIGAKDQMKADITDEEALRQFQDTVQFENKRYQVALPWKSKDPDLANNYGLAYGRLKSTLNRLKQDEKLMKEYSDIIKKQEEKGIIEKAPDEPTGLTYYLPHHPVITPTKKTTKVRIVYDASSKARKGLSSLNDCLLRGPVILDDLCGLLLRFRLHKVALTSDIEKAFLQVRLQKQERDVARFLWVKNPRKPPTGSNLTVYRFTSVFFGAISSPFLLGATIDTHLRQSEGPIAEKIRKNIYVDNVITGEETETDTIVHYQEAKRLFLGANMNLREFHTNSATVREAIAPEDRGNSTEPKVLGIKWIIANDSLKCSGLKSDQVARTTKREIASQTAQVYDPCGWFSPVVVKAKLLIQELWKLDVTWDDPVPGDIAKRWVETRTELKKISEASIPRYIGCSARAIVQLHAFCDASIEAMGVSVYLRVDNDGLVKCDLTFAKTRLAPLKPQQTIPRLELVGLVMAVNMVNFVAEQLRLPVEQKFVWCDSQCVLYWLTKEKLGTKFVERRIHEIRKSTDIVFRYVPSADNPADLPSRGCSMTDLMNSEQWWHGPAWLQRESEVWPKDRTARVFDESIVEVSTQLVAVESTKPTAIFDPQKFSTCTRLLRVTAYVKRYLKNLRIPPLNRRIGILSVYEISAARVYWERLAQAQAFPKIFYHRTLTPDVLKRSTLAQLNIFRDDNSLLRCRGRLQNANLPFDMQNPILLPKCHPFTDHVIRDVHAANGHAGVGQTLHDVRQRYWIIQGRSRVKQIQRTCKRCIRVEGGPFDVPPPPALPDFRVTEQAPFTATGLDYLGFLIVKVTSRTNKKVWVCLCTCAVTRAVHLELVEDQSANEFHLALRRFIAIRGCPKLIVSDNASQFGTVENAMNKLWKTLTSSTETEEFAVQKGIEWKRIPEKSPWMGGFFERLVGTVKKFLKKALDGICVNTSELRTILAEITSIINSRPLLYVEDDVTSKQLCPADLLGQTRPQLMPTFDEESKLPSTNSTTDQLVSRWRRLQAVTSSFWNDWKQGYLTSLREKHANATQRNPSLIQPTVGSVVQIKDKLPRARWRLGRIERMIPSGDGKIRSVHLRVANKRILIRPLKLLYPLEMHVNPSIDQPDRPRPVITGYDSPSLGPEHAQNADDITDIVETNDLDQEVNEPITPTCPFYLNDPDPYPSENYRPQRKAAIEARKKLQKLAREGSSDEE
jgi:hypothetical protein